MNGERRRRAGFGGRRKAPEKPADPESARLSGIGMLARRDFARRALRERLIDRGYEPEAAEAAVVALEDERLLDDARLAGTRIAGRISRGHGPLRIALELQRSGLERDLVAAAMKVTDVDWGEQAAIVLQRRFGATAPADATERACRARFLFYRGFRGDHVRAAFAHLKVATDEVDFTESDEDLTLTLDEDVDS